MMRADPAHPALRNQITSSSTCLSEDEALLSSFDPMIEGSSFQVLDSVLDTEDDEAPVPAFSSEDGSENSIPEVLSTFNLSESFARIPAKIFFRIGEVADLLEVKAYVLRFWETEFPMVHPSKSRSGQRVYRKKDVEMLLLIKHLLYVERFSIEGARKRIRELKMKPASVASALAAPTSTPVTASPGVTEALTATPGLVFSAEKQSAVKELIRNAKEFASAPLTKFFRF